MQAHLLIYECARQKGPLLTFECIKSILHDQAPQVERMSTNALYEFPYNAIHIELFNANYDVIYRMQRLNNIKCIWYTVTSIMWLLFWIIDALSAYYYWIMWIIIQNDGTIEQTCVILLNLSLHQLVFQDNQT